MTATCLQTSSAEEWRWALRTASERRSLAAAVLSIGNMRCKCHLFVSNTSPTSQEQANHRDVKSKTGLISQRKRRNFALCNGHSNLLLTRRYELFLIKIDLKERLDLLVKLRNDVETWPVWWRHQSMYELLTDVERQQKSRVFGLAVRAIVFF